MFNFILYRTVCCKLILELTKIYIKIDLVRDKCKLKSFNECLGTFGIYFMEYCFYQQRQIPISHHTFILLHAHVRRIFEYSNI